MNSLLKPLPLPVPVDEEHVRMMDYARSLGAQANIASAQAEIDAGNGIVADAAYFEALRLRRAKRRKG